MQDSATRIVAVLVAVLAIAPPVCAQNPEIVAFRDSVAAVSDVPGLHRVTWADPPKDAAAPSLVRQGFAGLRLYELTGLVADLRRARDRFEDATKADPALAAAELGLGMSWLRDPEITDPAPTVIMDRAFNEALGRDARSRASRALRRALEHDPDLTEAAVLLAGIATEKRDTDELEAARTSLARAEAEGRTDADANLALARVAAAQNDFDTARRAAVRATRAPDPPPGARLALARALLGQGELEAGARTYFAAIDSASEATIEAIYDDARPIATETELAEWQAADSAGRRAWLHRYWDVRAALSGESVAARLAEHYRRLDRAIRDYPRLRRYGAPPSNALLLERPDLPFDDRGIILVRHGEPARIIRSPGQLRNESWAYHALEGGYRLLHFVQYASALSAGGGAIRAGNPRVSGIDGAIPQAYNDFVLVYNVLCDPEYLSDRMLLDRRLSFVSCDEFDRRSVSAEVRRDARAALASDSDRPFFGNSLPFIYDLVAFRGDYGRTDLTAAVALPARALHPTATSSGTRWSIDVSSIVVDTDERRIVRADTSLVIREDGAGTPDDIVLATLAVPVVPGQHLAHRLVVRDRADTTSGGMLGRVIDIPDFAGDSLMLSDVVLAAPGETGSFRRGSVALRLVPTREYRGGAFDVFYEVYNLPADHAYATEVRIDRAGGGIGRAIKRLFGGGGPQVRLRFQGVAQPEPDGVVREIRSVESELSPGRYRIRITLTDDVTGRAVTRERPFTVIERREQGS
ncbi:MAG: hypothetical protein PVH00_03355 [Gemmatimonadota bacterium]|jgi:hypothetical protein